MINKHSGFYPWSYFPHETVESLQAGDASSTFFDYVDENEKHHSLQMIHYNFNDCLIEEYYAEEDCGELYFDFETKTVQKVSLPQKRPLTKFFFFESGSAFLVLIALLTTIFFSSCVVKALNPDGVKYKLLEPKGWGIFLISFSCGMAASLPVWMLSNHFSRKAENLLTERKSIYE